MKSQKISLYLSIVLFLSFIRCGFDSLSFSKGKFIYWLIGVVIGGLYFLVNRSKRRYVLNDFDVFVLILFTIGFWNLIYISKSTIYNINIWYYMGYLILYFVLRQELNTKDIIYKNLNFILYFISVTAIINVVIAVLQSNNILQSPNEYFNSTGLFFSPNQLGAYLSLGFLSTLEILRKSKIKSIKIVFYIGLLILIYGLYLSECRGAYLGLIIVFLFWFYNSNYKTKKSFKWRIILSGAALLSLLFLIIWNNNSVKSESTSGRLFIIKQSLERIKEHPVSGHGINSFSLQYNLAKAKYFTVERNWDDIKNASYIYNANNDFLELTFELGVVWLIVFIFFLIRLGFFSTQTEETKICSSILLCIFVFALTNTILSTPLFLVIGCYCVVFVVNLSSVKPIYTFNNSIFLQIGFVVIGFTFLGIMFLRLNAEHKLLSYYNGEKHFVSLKNIKNYITKIDAGGEELFMAGAILLKNKHHEEGISYLAQGFEHSGKPSLGKILAGFYVKQSKYNEAEQIYQYNMNVEPFRYDAHIDLFRLYIKTNQKTKAKEMAFKIILLPIKIPSEKINKYKEEAIFYLRKAKK
jgi:O-antigen ligase